MRACQRRAVSSMSINRVNISGNLTRDPELKTTTGGTSVLTFGVAVNDRRRNPQTGESKKKPACKVVKFSLAKAVKTAVLAK